MKSVTVLSTGNELLYGKTLMPELLGRHITGTLLSDEHGGIYGPDFPGETFRVLKKKEERKYGEYRTRRLVLDAWDKLA